MSIMVKTVSTIIFGVFTILLTTKATGAGFSDYIVDKSREIQTGEYTMNAITQNQDLMYFIELVVIGLMALALVSVTLSIFYSRWAGKREHLLIRKLRHKAELDKDEAIKSYDTIHEMQKKSQEVVNTLNIQLNELSDKQETTFARSDEIEMQAERVARYENQLKQDIDAMGKRMEQIQTYWDQQFEETVETIAKIHDRMNESISRLDNSLEKVAEQEKLANDLSIKMSEQYNKIIQEQEENTRVNKDVHKVLDDTLLESTRLLEQLKKYQDDSEKVFGNFTSELNSYESQAFEHFDAIYNAVDVARKELDANLEESRKQVSELRDIKKDVKKGPRSVTNRTGRPLLAENLAEELSQTGSKKYSYEDDPAKDTLVSFFSKRK
jgi:hypothetical protein